MGYSKSGNIITQTGTDTIVEKIPNVTKEINIKNLEGSFYSILLQDLRLQVNGTISQKISNFIIYNLIFDGTSSITNYELNINSSSGSLTLQGYSPSNKNLTLTFLRKSSNSYSTGGSGLRVTSGGKINIKNGILKSSSPYDFAGDGEIRFTDVEFVPIRWSRNVNPEIQCIGTNIYLENVTLNQKIGFKENPKLFKNVKIYNSTDTDTVLSTREGILNKQSEQIFSHLQLKDFRSGKLSWNAYNTDGTKLSGSGSFVLPSSLSNSVIYYVWLRRDGGTGDEVIRIKLEYKNSKVYIETLSSARISEIPSSDLVDGFPKETYTNGGTYTYPWTIGDIILNIDGDYNVRNQIIYTNRAKTGSIGLEGLAVVEGVQTLSSTDGTKSELTMYGFCRMVAKNTNDERDLNYTVALFTSDNGSTANPNSPAGLFCLKDVVFKVVDSSGDNISKCTINFTDNNSGDRVEALYYYIKSTSTMTKRTDSSIPSNLLNDVNYDIDISSGVSDEKQILTSVRYAVSTIGNGNSVTIDWRILETQLYTIFSYDYLNQSFPNSLIGDGVVDVEFTIIDDINVTLTETAVSSLTSIESDKDLYDYYKYLASRQTTAGNTVRLLDGYTNDLVTRNSDITSIRDGWSVIMNSGTNSTPMTFNSSSKTITIYTNESFIVDTSIVFGILTFSGTTSLEGDIEYTNSYNELVSLINNIVTTQDTSASSDYELIYEGKNNTTYEKDDTLEHNESYLIYPGAITNIQGKTLTLLDSDDNDYMNTLRSNIVDGTAYWFWLTEAPSSGDGEQIKLKFVVIDGNTYMQQIDADKGSTLFSDSYVSDFEQDYKIPGFKIGSFSQSYNEIDSFSGSGSRDVFIKVIRDRFSNIRRRLFGAIVNEDDLTDTATDFRRIDEVSVTLENSFLPLWKSEFDNGLRKIIIKAVSNTSVDIEIKSTSDTGWEDSTPQQLNWAIHHAFHIWKEDELTSLTDEDISEIVGTVFTIKKKIKGDVIKGLTFDAVGDLNLMVIPSSNEDLLTVDFGILTETDTKAAAKVNNLLVGDTIRYQETDTASTLISDTITTAGYYIFVFVKSKTYQIKLYRSGYDCNLSTISTTAREYSPVVSSLLGLNQENVSSLTPTDYFVVNDDDDGFYLIKDLAEYDEDLETAEQIEIDLWFKYNQDAPLGIKAKHLLLKKVNGIVTLNYTLEVEDTKDECDLKPLFSKNTDGTYNEITVRKTSSGSDIYLDPIVTDKANLNSTISDGDFVSFLNSSDDVLVVEVSSDLVVSAVAIFTDTSFTISDVSSTKLGISTSLPISFNGLLHSFISYGGSHDTYIVRSVTNTGTDNEDANITLEDTDGNQITNIDSLTFNVLDTVTFKKEYNAHFSLVSSVSQVGSTISKQDYIDVTETYLVGNQYKTEAGRISKNISFLTRDVVVVQGGLTEETLHQGLDDYTGKDNWKNSITNSSVADAVEVKVVDNVVTKVVDELQIIPPQTIFPLYVSEDTMCIIKVKSQYSTDDIILEVNDSIPTENYDGFKFYTSSKALNPFVIVKQEEGSVLSFIPQNLNNSDSGFYTPGKNYHYKVYFNGKTRSVIGVEYITNGVSFRFIIEDDEDVEDFPQTISFEYDGVNYSSEIPTSGSSIGNPIVQYQFLSITLDSLWHYGDSTITLNFTYTNNPKLVYVKPNTYIDLESFVLDKNLYVALGSISSGGSSSGGTSLTTAQAEIIKGLGTMIENQPLSTTNKRLSKESLENISGEIEEHAITFVLDTN